MDETGLGLSNAIDFKSWDYTSSYTRHQNGMMDDESTDDEEAEDYAPDPREYYSHFYSESERLLTFQDWPHWANVTKEDLAKNGFMYLHVSDRVQCVFCRACLASFSLGDVVANEHRKYCPECPFAFGYECGNIPIPSANKVQQQTQTVQSHNARNRAMITSVSSVVSNLGTEEVITEPKYRDWADELTRLRSYRGWPAQVRQTPRALAAAGLLYTGNGDRCKCFWCGGELYGWNPDDDPWVEHEKWFPHCGFLRIEM
jgi:hypothetical protein